MKKVALAFLVLLVIIATGCDYDIPLTEKQGLPLDTSLIGLWENVTDQKEKERIIISRHSQFEYSIRLFSENDEGTYFLAYPIKVANISCIQLIGTDEKYTPVNELKKHLVISYEISGGNLIIKKLNTDIVSSELKSSVELRKIFLQNKDNKNLFSKVGSFKKVNTTESKKQNLETDGQNLEIELRNAVLKADLVAVRKLLAKGVNVNAASEEGPTALMLAANIGNLSILQILLAKGADVNAQAKDGQTALMRASMNGHLPVVRALLLKGANVNAKENTVNFTALMLASGNGHLAIVQALLLKGADLYMENKLGGNALTSAAYEGHTKIVQAILAKIKNIDAKDDEGFTLLLKEAGRGNTVLVQALLDKGANVNVKSKEGITPLMAACLGGHLPVVELLLAKGADVNASAGGFTALDFADSEGHAEIVKLLKQKQK